MAKKKHDRWAEAQSSGLDALEKSGYRFSSPPQVEEAQAPIEPESRPLMSLSRGSVLNDWVTEGVNSAASGMSSIGKFIAPGNSVSKAIDTFVEDSQGNFTDAAKQGKQSYEQEMQAAQGVGDEVSATLRYLANNPGMGAAQAIGSFAGPGLAIKGAGLGARALGAGAAGVTRAGLAAGATMGGAMAGGDAAGTAYDLVIKAGGTPEQAESAAREASVIPGAIGAAGGLVGAERLFAGGKGFAGNAVSRALKTAGVEGLQEGFEEGATQYEGQRAAMPYDPSIDPMKGVAGAATMGAVMGGATGGGISLITGEPAKAGDPIRDLKTGGTDPLSRAADIGLDAKAKQADAGITEGQYNAAMAAMEGQLSDDQKAIKNQGRADKTGFAGQPTPKAPSMAQAMGLMGDATQEVSAFTDRAMLVKESLADPTTRDFIRQNMGDEAFNEAAYYAEQADRPGDIPDKTRENMLALAEAIISRARLTPITPPAGLGSNVGPALDALGAPQAVPAIGLDTTPTGAFRVDAAGNAAPEVRADVISTRQAQAERDVLGAQARKSSAVPADPAPAQPQAPKALGYDTAPTGVVRVDSQGQARPETRADQINARQSAPARDDTTGQQARKASAVWADPAPKKRETPALGYDVSPTGRMVAGPDGISVETNAERINRQQARSTQPGDITRPGGQPFKNLTAAKTEQRRSGGAVVEVTGGWVVRPQAETINGDTGQTAGRSAGSVGAGSPDAPAGPSGAGFSPDVRGGTDAGGSGRADGAGVPERNIGSPVAAQPGAARDARGQLSSPAFLRKTLPEMTEGELTQASEFYGADHPRASKVKQEVEKRERKAAFEAKRKPKTSGAALPPTDIRMGDEVIKDGKTYVVSGGIEGGIVATRTVADGHEVDVFLKGDDAIRARIAAIEATKPEQANEQDAPQTQSAPTQAQPGQEGSDPAGTGAPGDGAKERVPGAGGADVQANGVTGQVVDKRPKARKHPPTVRGSGALADISRALGGLSPDLLSDLSEKVRRTRVSKAGKKTQYTTWDNPAIPGIGPLFRMGGTADLSEVARVLEESGYLEAGAVENDPVGAKQRAEAIIKAELREGGRTLRVGDADAIESEMRGRQEAAMDEMSDPWDDFSFAPEDLDAAGYTGLSEETRAATEQLIAEAEGLGIDTEAIRDDTARIVGDSASQEEYHAATQEALRQAIAQVGRNAQQADASGAREGDQGGGSPAEQAGGTRSQGQRDSGSDQEGLSLTAPTRADIEAQQDRAEQADTLDEKAQAKRESEVGDSTFMTGFTGDGRQDNTADLFSQAAQPDAAPEPAESQPITEAEARKRLEWRDMGQRDNTKRLQLSFQDADGRPMTYGTLTKDTGAKAWTVADSDGWRHSLLTAAKKKAEDLAIERLRKDGYVTKEQDQQAATGGSNDRDTFTLERLNRETNKMESVTFKRGEYIRHRIGEKDHFGEIDGISQARREFSVGGLWHPMGFANKAERPAAPVKKTEPLSKTIEKVNAKNGEDLTDADRVPEKKPASKTPTVDRHMEVMEAVRNDKGSIADYKASFAALEGGEASVKAELATKTKDDLLRAGGAHFHMRYKSETKPDIIKAFYNDLLSEYALGKTYGSNSWIMSSGGMAAHYKRQHEALRALVEAQTQEDLDNFAKEVADRRAEYKAEREAKQAAMANPQTLSDFRSLLNVKIREGMTRAEAFLTLTPEQRIKYDELEADGTKESREAAKRAAKTAVRSAGQTTAGEIVATKHTRDGHDLWVVKLADRLSADDYRTVLASAKRLGGSYSSFRGNGAIPGFQFRTPEAAQAFLKLAGGDTTEAQGLAEQRRDAFDDDRSQSAVERLNEMADKLDDRAQESIDRDRKTNTARRARFAASADREAQEAKALAQTMRNIAKAIEEGRAKFLDGVRTRTQVELLRNRVAAAKQDELRAKHPAYADQEKRRGEPATAETADFAEFPSFSAFRSDLASLARQMLEVDGTKKLGQRLMSVTDDVTDAYIEFAKKPENLYKLSTFSIRQGDDVKTAIFPSKDTAERAIRRSGLADRAIVLSEKRGVNRIIMSPSEAMSRGVWTGDGDKRITLTREFGSEMVQAIGRRGSKTNRLTVPWQFQTAHDRLNAIKRIGIETPSEYRSALREFIGLQERAIVNKAREMELSMAGRKNDGLDFFPTPAEVADQMVAAADISPDMAVLEPSAGMGHIADRIREAGAEPDVIEFDEDRAELLREKGYHHVSGHRDFMAMEPRKFFTYGDVFRAPDGTEGVMQGTGGMGSTRVVLKPLIDGVEVDYRRGEWYNRDDLVGVRHRGSWSGYDRIIMNPPFSNGRDIEHVMHAYDLLKPGGRIVAIMGESAFFNQSKKAEAFRQWLDDKGGTSEKLPAGSFMDPSLPVNTGVNARMVVIDKREADEQEPGNFSRSPEDESFYRSQVDYEWAPPSVVNRVKQQVESLRTFWKNSPEVVVLASFADAPVEMQKLNDKQVQNGAVGEPEGFFYKGKAYLLAPHMKGPEDVRRVLFHETLGHLGLRGVFGDGLNQILDQLWATRRKDVQAKADAYGLDTSKQGNRRMAAEEVLAEMAQDRPEIGFVRRAVAIVKQWLRKNLPGFAKMKMSDDEIIANFLMPAQRFIERGQGAQGQQLVPAFSRVDEAGSGFGRGDNGGMTKAYAYNELRTALQAWEGAGVAKAAPELLRAKWKRELKAALDSGSMSADDMHKLAYNSEVAVQPYAGRIGGLSFDDSKSPVVAKMVEAVKKLAASGKRHPPTVLPEDGGFAVVVDGFVVGRYDTEADAQDGIGSIDAEFWRGEMFDVDGNPRLDRWAPSSSGGFSRGAASAAQAADLNTKARNAFSDFVGSAGVQMDWLDKTLKTQYAKAERFPEFKRVFDKLQDYIEGVSSFANQAADKAPDILPKLDSFKDLMREGPESLLRHGLSQEDIKALSAPVFEGTLSWARDANGELVETQDPASAGVVFTDAELRDKFGMSKKQIGHYRQFRATVDESLDQVVAADIIKLLGKKAPAGLKALANTADGRARLREALRQTFGNSDDAGAKAVWDDQIAPKYDHVASMKAKGYAPLSRFGKFFVHVVDKQTGETAYFGMEETRIMSNQRARDMRGDFGPGFDVTQGTMSQESYKLMSDVPVDAMEMFASAIGAEKSEVFQKYIALAKNNRSTLKRLLKRKGRKGYSLDAPRVLASFVTSNARASAAAVNMMDAKELAQDIQAGDVKDEAIKLIEAVSEPQESGAKVRGLMFINFIGGSIASAVVNMTQPVMMTLPYLSQFGGITKAGKRLVSAAGMAVSGKVSDPEISEALKRAESEGIVAPQEIHHLLKQATSSAHINPKVDAAIQKLAFVWSTPFALAESFNRKASFIAAYQTAKDEGIANPYAFAQKAVTETQGLYNSGNKPNAARGTLGATVMTFKQYSIHYLEWLARMAKSGPEGKKAALWALALLVMAAGSDGLPFSEDLNDVIDTVGQSFGYDTNTKRWRHQVAADALGEEAAEVLSRGLSASAGFPVDVSMRMGMGNLLPATDMLKKSNTDTARSLAELAGPGGALFTQYSDAIKLMLSGEAGAAAMKMTPNAIQNLGKAAKMMETGEYRDSKDRKVMEVDGVDAAMKALSFQPAQIARESAKMSENRQSEMLAKAVEGEITDAWARAMVDGDAQAQEGARQRLLDWNKKNPDMPIRVNRAQIATKAKKMRQSRAERYIKTVAPERRQAAAKEVES